MKWVVGCSGGDKEKAQTQASAGLQQALQRDDRIRIPGETGQTSNRRKWDVVPIWNDRKRVLA